MTTETTATVTAGELVSAKTICLALKIGRFGNSKQLKLAGATFSANDPSQEPDKALLRGSKTLIDSPELVAVAKLDTALAHTIRRLAFSSLFKGGVYLVPIAMVQDIEAILQQAIERREALVDLAVAAYPQRIEETSHRLGVAFNPMDYPTVERYRKSFFIEYSYVTFDTPSRLKAISAALFQAEAEKQRARLESVAGECQQAMRAGLADLVEHLAERLTPGQDGKAKRLSTTTVEHLTDFLKTFELRNVTDDEQLGAIVAQARQVMAGVDRKVLKSDELIRQKMLTDLSNVKALLDPLIVDKATRQISLDEDE